MNLQQVYQALINDEKIKNAYQIIEEKEMTSTLLADTGSHSIGHINNVIKYSEKIAKLLNFSDEELAAVKICALLHDIGNVNGPKVGHAERSYQLSQEYLNQFEIKPAIKAEILNAIKYHSEGYDSKIGVIVAFADKIDICKDRILPMGYQAVGPRQYIHLLAVDFKVINNCLMIAYTSDGNLNKEEMSQYSFTHKVFKMIERLAEYFNLEYQVLLDDSEWVLMN